MLLFYELFRDVRLMQSGRHRLRADNGNLPRLDILQWCQSRIRAHDGLVGRRYYSYDEMRHWIRLNWCFVHLCCFLVDRSREADLKFPQSTQLSNKRMSKKRYLSFIGLHGYSWYNLVSPLLHKLLLVGGILRGSSLLLHPLPTPSSTQTLPAAPQACPS